MAEAEEYEEAEVWAMMKARRGSGSGSNSISKMRKSGSTTFSTSSSSIRAIIPRSSGGASSSAPLAVPEWSKILKKQPNKKVWDDACKCNDDDGDDDGDDGGGVCRNDLRSNNDDGDDAAAAADDDYGEMLPPHEYLARRLASTQIASFSMCEGGVGRTLKGRDLSNLRNAILTKTGFLE